MMTSPGGVKPIRLIHLSDIHIAVRRPRWRWADLATKRTPGWFNLRCLGRGKHFDSAERILQALALELRSSPPDCVIFSGDATALGFEEELARAAQLLGVREQDNMPGIAVPGNHDYYTRAAAASGAFERYFAPWQKGKRIGDAIYPFARRIGRAWFIAVNSCTGNRWFWDAAGSVGAEQLERLEILLGQLDSGLRILVTHYPAWLSSGQPERFYRRLRDRDALLEIARRGKICLWLHGHRHTAYHLAPRELAPFPIICAGSATREGTWSYGDYTLNGHRLSAVRRAFSLSDNAFKDAERFAIELPRFKQA